MDTSQEEHFQSLFGEEPEVVEGADHQQTDNENHYADEDDQPSTTIHSDIPNPEPTLFDSLDALEAFLHRYSKDHGFEIVRAGASRKNARGEIRRRGFKCAKGVSRGSLEDYRKKQDALGMPQKRARHTKKTGCAFSLTAYSIDNENPTECQWTFCFGRTPGHNHPSDDPTRLANHRRRGRYGLEQFLRNARRSNIKTRKPRRHDVYNAWTRVRKEALPEGDVPHGPQVDTIEEPDTSTQPTLTQMVASLQAQFKRMNDFNKQSQGTLALMATSMQKELARMSERVAELERDREAREQRIAELERDAEMREQRTAAASSYSQAPQSTFRPPVPPQAPGPYSSNSVQQQHHPQPQQQL